MDIVSGLVFAILLYGGVLAAIFALLETKGIYRLFIAVAIVMYWCLLVYIFEV